MPIRPDTELPWNDVECTFVWRDERNLFTSTANDRDFIVHACNAYEKLVSHIKADFDFMHDSDKYESDEYTILKELGEL